MRRRNYAKSTEGLRFNYEIFNRQTNGFRSSFEKLKNLVFKKNGQLPNRKKFDKRFRNKCRRATNKFTCLGFFPVKEICRVHVFFCPTLGCSILLIRKKIPSWMTKIMKLGQLGKAKRMNERSMRKKSGKKQMMKKSACATLRWWVTPPRATFHAQKNNALAGFVRKPLIWETRFYLFAIVVIVVVHRTLPVIYKNIETCIFALVKLADVHSQGYHFFVTFYVTYHPFLFFHFFFFSVNPANRTMVVNHAFDPLPRSTPHTPQHERYPSFQLLLDLRPSFTLPIFASIAHHFRSPSLGKKLI